MVSDDQNIIDPSVLARAHTVLAGLNASERIAWSLNHTPGPHMLTSSFGAQAAVMLHLVTEQRADIPVVVVDTGYLFPQTYMYIDLLVSRLNLNLIVVRPLLSPAWQEARYGKRWETGPEGIKEYNQMNKVEPLQRTMQELGVGTWFTGLRREQSKSRKETPFIDVVDGRVKLQPIADWSLEMVSHYLTKHSLPVHPLLEQGYASMGDWHSTTRLEPGMTEEETRFGGLIRECGLHQRERSDI